MNLTTCSLARLFLSEIVHEPGPISILFFCSLLAYCLGLCEILQLILFLLFEVMQQLLDPICCQLQEPGPGFQVAFQITFIFQSKLLSLSLDFIVKLQASVACLGLYMFGLGTYFLVMLSLKKPVNCISSRPSPKLNPFFGCQNSLLIWQASGDGHIFSNLIPISLCPYPNEVDLLLLTDGRLQKESVLELKFFYAWLDSD